MLEIVINEKNFKNKEIKKEIFKDTSFKIFDDEDIVTLWGPSGSGKTTLFNMLLAIDNDFDGQILYNGVNIVKENLELEYRNSIITCVFQDYKLLENLTVFDNLELVNYNNYSKEEILKIIKNLSMEENVDKICKNLSGGEKQRVAIARALVMDTKYILFDEPTTGLDDENFDNFINIINSIRKLNKKIIIVTHDSRFKNIPTEIYEIKDKKIVPKDFKKGNSISNENIKDIKIEKRFTKFPLSKISFSYKKSIFFNSIFILISLIFFVLLISGITYVMDLNFNYFYGGIDDKTIVIKADELNEESMGKILGVNIMNGIDDRFAWSQEDVDKVSSIDNVEDVDLATTDSFLLGDSELYDPAIVNVDEFSLGVSSANAPEKIEFKFQTMIVPKNFAKGYYPLPYEKEYGLEYGDFPADGTDEVLIPDILATKYSPNNIEELVGKEISIPVINNDNPNNKTDKNYKVSGIYKTNYKNKVEQRYDIYIGYVDAPVLSYDLYDQQLELYNNLGARFQGDELESIKAYYKEVMSSKEAYSQAIGTGMTTMLIKVDDYGSQKEILNKLEELYPHNLIKSQYYYKNGKYKNMYIKLILEKIISILIIVILFSILNIILFRNYYKLRIKEISLIKVLGYKNIKVNMWILLELITVFLLGSILFILIAQIIKLYLSLFQINWLLLFTYIFINIFVLYIFIVYKVKNSKIANNIK